MILVRRFNMSKNDNGSDETKSESKNGTTEKGDHIYICSNGCGFSTRYPKHQALKAKKHDKNNKVTESRLAEEPYHCPNCDLNGGSSKLNQTS